MKKIEKEEQPQEKALSFLEELKYRDAVSYFEQFEYEKAIKVLLPLALGGNKLSQDLMCEIIYEISAEETERCVLIGLEPDIKDRIIECAEKDEGWACFIVHCFRYADYHSVEEYPSVLEYLVKSLQVEERGLSYLRYGIMIEWGMVPDINVKDALVCYEKAIGLGCKQAYGYIGQYYSSIDEMKSVDYLKEGVKSGDSFSYGKLFNYYVLKTIPIDDAKMVFLSENKDIGNLENAVMDYSKKVYYCKQAESLAHNMLEHNIKNAYYYYGEAMVNMMLLTSNESYYQKAEAYLNAALEHKQYKAYGSLAILYCHDEEKERAYAEEGVKKSDSISRSILIDFERKRGHLKRAWDLAMDRWCSVGTGSEVLAEMYFKNHYRAKGFTLEKMDRIVEVGLRTNTTTVYSSIKGLLRDPNCKKEGSIDFDKYQKIAADLGDTAAIIDYWERLIDVHSGLYNPDEGCRYMEVAISKGSIEASRILLKYYAKEDGNAKINAIRNKVIGNKTFVVDNEFFELLFPTVLDFDNVASFKKLMETVAYDTSNTYYEINRKKACAKLLINHYDGVWTLSSEERKRLLDEARDVARKTPQYFVFFKSIWKEVFPGFNVDELSLEDRWLDLLYCAFFESTEAEATLVEKHKNISKQKSVVEIVKEYKQLCDEYEKLSDRFNNLIVLRKRSVSEFKYFNNTFYFEFKKELLKLFVSIMMQPELRDYFEVLITINNYGELAQIDRLDVDSSLKLLLFQLFMVKIDLEDIPVAINKTYV